jgi:arginase family enzyme
VAVAALTGDADSDLLGLLPATVRPDRPALVGLHDWTEDDIPDIADWGIKSFAADQLRHWTQTAARLARNHWMRPLAIHFDVDTIDSNDLVLELGAAHDGLTSTQLRRIVADITRRPTSPASPSQNSSPDRSCTCSDSWPTLPCSPFSPEQDPVGDGAGATAVPLK